MNPNNQPVWDILFGLCIAVACVTALIAMIAFLVPSYMLAARAAGVAFFTALGSIFCNSFRVGPRE